MILEDLFQLLSHGELNNLSVAVDGNGAIRKEQQNRIVVFANEGLRKLHLRFSLREEHEELLLPKDADLDHPLPADALLVTHLITPHGQQLTVDTRRVSDIIYVAGGILHVPKWVSGTVQTLQATYRMRHPQLQPTYGVQESPGTQLEQEIHLAPELHEALTAYIAHKMYSGMGSQEGQAQSAMYLNRYEQCVQDALFQGALPGELGEVQKFHARGFV